MTIPSMTRVFAVLMTLLALFPVRSEARTKLAAVPEREAAVIRLDNQRATLIQESRTLTLQQGKNQVDFSWKGVRIDQDSIRLDILSHKDSVTLLSVSYPPQEPSLVWSIHSKMPAQVEVRISYLLSRIDSLSTYKGVVNHDETELDLIGFQIVRNFSGEDFGPTAAFFGNGNRDIAELRHEETKQLLDLSSQATPLKKKITFDSREHPWDPEAEETTVGLPVSYRIRNIHQSGLGQSLLPRGKMRLFIEDGRGGLVFLGEDRVGPVPAGQDMEVTVGQSRDVKLTQRIMSKTKVNVRRNTDNHVVLYDQEERVTAELENFKDTPVLLELIEHIPGEWEMVTTNMDYSKEDANTLTYEVEIPARGGKELVMHYRRRNIRR